MGRHIKAALKVDRQQRAANVASEMEGHLAAGDPKEAWRCIQGWYRVVEDRAPKPFYESMSKQTAEREELHRKIPPRGPYFYQCQALPSDR